MSKIKIYSPNVGAIIKQFVCAFMGISDAANNALKKLESSSSIELSHKERQPYYRRFEKRNPNR